MDDAKRILINAGLLKEDGMETFLGFMPDDETPKSAMIDYDTLTYLLNYVKQHDIGVEELVNQLKEINNKDGSLTMDNLSFLNEPQEPTNSFDSLEQNYSDFKESFKRQ